MFRGRFAHAHIGKTEPVRYEALLGWAIHYATGVAFAALLAILAPAEWVTTPTPGLALAVGLGTVAAPFLLMQPAFGFGFAASKLPNRNAARLRSIMTHLVFGFGLYLAAVTVSDLARS